MNAILILNDQAGSIAHGNQDSFSPENITAVFNAAGINVVIHRAAGPALTAALRTALQQQPEAIFVGGGDGTISAAAGLLADTGIPLGLLPVGTLNHFCHDLGLPSDWQEAIRAQAAGNSRPVDLGEVNGHVFINNCSLGSYAQAVRHRDALRRERGHGKGWAMVIASLAVFRSLRRMRLQIELPAVSLALRTPFLLVSNNHYSGRIFESALRPRLDEGLLWLYTTRAKKRATLLRLLVQTLLRKIDEADALETHSATEAVIRIERGPLPVAADGEVLDLQPPLRFRLRKAALLVLAPLPVASAA